MRRSERVNERGNNLIRREEKCKVEQDDDERQVELARFKHDDSHLLNSRTSVRREACKSNDLKDASGQSKLLMLMQKEEQIGNIRIIFALEDEIITQSVKEIDRL